MVSGRGTKFPNEGTARRQLDVWRQQTPVQEGGGRHKDNIQTLTLVESSVLTLALTINLSVCFKKQKQNVIIFNTNNNVSTNNMTILHRYENKKAA